MRGSGIFTELISLYVSCPHCDTGWADDFVTDDWGRVEETILCFNCNETFEVYSSKEEDVIDPDAAWDNREF